MPCHDTQWMKLRLLIQNSLSHLRELIHISRFSWLEAQVLMAELIYCNILLSGYQPFITQFYTCQHLEIMDKMSLWLQSWFTQTHFIYVPEPISIINKLWLLWKVIYEIYKSCQSAFLTFASKSCCPLLWSQWAIWREINAIISRVMTHWHCTTTLHHLKWLHNNLT